MNKSKTYLLPLISEKLNFKHLNFIKNTYIKDDSNKYTKSIFIEYDNKAFLEESFVDYENELELSEGYIDTIETFDDTTIYIFKFPIEYMHDYTKFTNGLYSRFKTESKEIVLNFTNKLYENWDGLIDYLIKLKHVLYRDEKLRRKLEKELSGPGSPIHIDPEAELSDPCDIELETLKLKNNEHNDREDSV